MVISEIAMRTLNITGYPMQDYMRSEIQLH